MAVLLIMVAVGAGLGLVYGADVASKAPIPADGSVDVIYGIMATHTRWGAIAGLAIGVGLWIAQIWQRNTGRSLDE